MLILLSAGPAFAEDRYGESASKEESRETYELLADEIEDKASSIRGMLDEMDAEFRNSMATIAEIESASRDIGILEREAIEYKLKGDSAELERIESEVRIKKDKVKQLKLKLPQSSDDFYSKLDIANDKAARIRLLAENMRDYCRRGTSKKREYKSADPENWEAVKFKGF